MALGSRFAFPLAALGVAVVMFASSAAAQQKASRGTEDSSHPCGKIYTNHYGPLDYNTQKNSVAVVEEFHFTPRVRAALGGSTGSFGQDINYTLKAVPNHAVALVSLMQWVERAKLDQTPGMEWPIECYFERATRFQPADTVVRGLYATFLGRRNRKADALRQLDIAVTHAGDRALSHHNIGLVYFELGEMEKALALAHKARALGMEDSALVALLKKNNRWRDAPEGAASAPPTAR